MTEMRTKHPEYLSSLFEPTAPAYFTHAAGFSNARYVQFTDLAETVYQKIFHILNDSQVDYYIFAGTMVGYVRDGKVPPWMDDIDVIILEDEIENFVSTALPRLRAAGFHCPVPQGFEEGGYHIVSLWNSETWKAGIPLTDDYSVQIPLAQVDVFFTSVNEAGCLRNLGGWGLYNYKDIPIEWVKPGRLVEMFDQSVKVFQEYEQDISKEYGDVQNNILVATHGTTFLDLPNKPWPDFAREYDMYRDQIRHNSLLTDEVLTRYAPGEPYTLVIDKEVGLLALLGKIVETQATHLVVIDRQVAFWAMDVKAVFPGLEIAAYADTPHQCARLAHLSDSIDKLYANTPELKSLLTSQLATLKVPLPVELMESE